MDDLDEREYLARAYPPFKERLTLEEFIDKLNGCDNKHRFVRAALLYEQASRCQSCEPNLAISLLCSTADAMKLVGKYKFQKNFEKFYMDHCPNELRVPPIQLRSGPVCFQKALEFIRKEFRDMYIHEGEGYVVPPPRKVTEHHFLHKFNGDWYDVNIPKTLQWFMSITQESLYRILIRGY